ncbi:hypothetical protein OOU_Y34scaffold00474g7 [Pyricularia oryzae Y34]|uniref:Uncharacterized protein n=2 Tax=Pyricularia oryzae TaxID=318829 RepID=A0AA97PMB9_PYRO3|nr:hypothetical protein OOU_Y34scaffold00474g7 [Pyricularia oryzae Y34]
MNLWVYYLRIAARDGMLGVKAFNIDLPGLSKTELILAALGEEDITKLL